nr:MAG TPA: hypothetical protein [Caudoviricetes sp.]
MTVVTLSETLMIILLFFKFQMVLSQKHFCP